MNSSFTQSYNYCKWSSGFRSLERGSHLTSVQYQLWLSWAPPLPAPPPELLLTSPTTSLNIIFPFILAACLFSSGWTETHRRSLLLLQTQMLLHLEVRCFLIYKHLMRFSSFSEAVILFFVMFLIRAFKQLFVSCLKLYCFCISQQILTLY